MSATSGPWWVTPAVAGDRDSWQLLYAAYGSVAGVDLDAGHLGRVWSWVLDPRAQTRCLLLREPDGGAVVGLAHYRVFERPLAGSLGCWLDDLYVDPRQRGRGGAQALLEHLGAVAEAEGWSTVRWTTGEANPAQRLYDRLARRNPVLTYDLAPGGAAAAD